jgi:hypothetical protein
MSDHRYPAARSDPTVLLVGSSLHMVLSIQTPIFMQPAKNSERGLRFLLGGLLRGPAFALRVGNTLARFRAQHACLPGLDLDRGFPGFALS